MADVSLQPKTTTTQQDTAHRLTTVRRPMTMASLNPSIQEADLLQAARYAKETAIYVDESNKAFIERTQEFNSQVRRYTNDCARQVRELNATLQEEQQFDPIFVMPRDPKLLLMAFTSEYYEFDMDVTTPTIFSLRFSGDFSDDQRQSLPIYGFVAVRDDREPLRNYIFNLPREEALELSPDSCLIEISLKVKRSDSSCEEDDDLLVDDCIIFRWDKIRRGRKLRSRIDGSCGALEMEYKFIKHGIEAVVEVDIPMELVGDHVVIIARSTGFSREELTIYDAVVEADATRVSAVLVASLKGTLYFGYLAMGARASGCTTVKVMKQGSYQGHVLVAFGSNMSKTSGCARPLPEAQRTHKIPFTVTFSTMGFYNDGS
ncbi:hypothetical protein ACP70R_015917 [Stipagrostis hirtigluma subsp. patula]